MFPSRKVEGLNYQETIFQINLVLSKSLKLFTEQLIILVAYHCKNVALFHQTP